MRMLDRKLMRDLRHIKGQVIAIAMVLAAGAAMLIMALSAHNSLQFSRDRYYEAYRFADLFAGLKRAPNQLGDKLKEIPGVAAAATRVTAQVKFDLPGLDQLATATMVSIRLPYRPSLNNPCLRTGRFPAPGSDQEILLSESFAKANKILPGAQVSAIINGRKRELRVVGLVLSPEFIYTIKPGDLLPDDRRYGIAYMGERTLAAALNMEGAFNDVSLKLAHGAKPQEVMRQLNQLLAPYGGLQAILRKDQISHFFLNNELIQLKNMAKFVPSIFFVVALFLLNLVISRLIQAQREQIAVLKAFGISNASVGLHFMKFVLVIVLLGSSFGIAAGVWLGSHLTRIYGDFYHFPILHYQLQPSLLISALLATAALSAIGTYWSVNRAVRLPPAEAMRPEPPASYRPSIVERIGLGKFISPNLRMILRHLERTPVRTLFSMVGLALAVSVLVVGRFNIDVVGYVVDIQFRLVQRHDLMLSFYEPRDYKAFHNISHLPGVIHAEPFRSVAVSLENGNIRTKSALTGMPSKLDLQRPIDLRLHPIGIPSQGILLSAGLAERLRVKKGDTLSVKVLEGKRPQFQVRITGIIEEYIGSSVLIEIGALNRLLGEGRVLSGAYLSIDPRNRNSLLKRLREMPLIASMTFKETTVRSMKETMAQNMLLISFFFILFASIIAFGVVYNSAQMALGDRARDLATLRVLGFTRAEISAILLGELAIVTLLALPLGFLLGNIQSYFIVENLKTELFRFPLYLSNATYGFATLTILLSSLISALVVRRKLDHLDLVSVLKARE